MMLYSCKLLEIKRTGWCNNRNILLLQFITCLQAYIEINVHENGNILNQFNCKLLCKLVCCHC